jgi:hypothetical protein
MDFRKQSNNELTANNSNSNLTIFKDESFVFLYKKTERLSTAIYLITNLMVVDEPIKWQLRKTSLDLLDNVMSLSNATMSSRESVIRDISQKLFQLISLYSVSFKSGFISEMNYKIVNIELNKLANFLNDYDLTDNQSRNKLFKEDFFTEDIDEIEKGQIEKDISIKDKIDRNIETFVKDNNGKGQNNKSNEKVLNKKDNSNTDKRTAKKTSNSDSSSKSVSRNKRREDIVNIVKQKGNVSVKDISSIIKDTSEKTIQRELISMVDDGVLLKEGERRWSRYMISKQ